MLIFIFLSLVNNNYLRFGIMKGSVENMQGKKKRKGNESL